MRKFFKRLAVLVVTAYANRLFKKAVELAEERHTKNFRRHYVLSNPVNESRLIVVNAKEFQTMRRQFSIPVGVVDANALKTQSWYYTTGRSKKDSIGNKDYETRRLAFVKFLLEKAKLA